MTTLFAETTLWQKNLASLIRSGLFDRAEVVEVKGLYAVVGIYRDGSHSAPLAKYSEQQRALQALAVVSGLVGPSVEIGQN
jgi:hypothetical protein